MQTVIPMLEHGNQPEPLTLQQCADQLKQDLRARVPAMITLKRWSSSGLLDHAKTLTKDNKRPKYVYAAVLAFVQSKHKNYSSKEASPPAESSQSAQRHHGQDRDIGVHDTAARAPIHKPTALGDAGAASTDTAFLLTSIERMLTPLVNDALGSVQRELGNGLSNLDAIRRMMMTKYENESTALRARVAELTSENHQLKSVSIDASKLNLQISRLSEKVDSLTTQLRGNP